VKRVTFCRLCDKVKHLENCIFYTDDWEAFLKVLSKECHIIGESYTVVIERDNSSTWHYLGWFMRRMKVVSKCDGMVDASLKLWKNLAMPEVFAQIQTIALSPYR
jgi:IS1 family transposase